MIPVLAIVQVRSPRVRFRFWAPLFLLWLLLLPLAILVLPFAVVIWAVQGINPIAAVARLGGVICALAGVQVDVKAPGTSVLVRIL